GHNGIKSVLSHLWNEVYLRNAALYFSMRILTTLKFLSTLKPFFRLRIGVSRPDSSDPRDVSDYVLSNFERHEMEILEDVVWDKAELEVMKWLKAEGLKA
ncbi:hypothetical protein HDU93_003862, partial [Gonapodya sp. JEL0774]